MSASDHIQPMIRVFHKSFSPIPPHEVGPLKSQRMMEEYGNAHPDVIHMGTESSMPEVSGNRQYLHEYELPEHLVYPVTFGDEDEEIKYEDRSIASGEDPSKTIYGIALAKKGIKQEGLFETIQGEPEFAIKTKTAVPYRNRVEGRGEISYMVPKDIIKSGDVRHVGVRNLWEGRT